MILASASAICTSSAWQSLEGRTEAALPGWASLQRQLGCPAQGLNGRAGLAEAEAEPIPPYPAPSHVSWVSARAWKKIKINKFWVAASQADTQVIGGLGKVRQGGQLAWEKK